MAVTFDFETDDIISVDDFVDQVKSIDLDSENEIEKLALDLKKLGNNNQWLNEFIHSELNELELKDSDDFQHINPYNPQVFILRVISERAFLRFAIWMPKQFKEVLDEDKLFSYEMAHNHDFTLLTTGILGSGYTTSIYEISDVNEMIGYIGEQINVSCEKKVRLKKGRVLLYKAGSDIHIQHEPETLSISLNLIVTQPQMNILQLYFDVANKQVGGYVVSAEMQRCNFLRLASAFSNENNKDYFFDIATKHSCELTRLYAFRVLSELYLKKEKVISLMKSDPSKLVSNSIHVLDKSLSESFIRP